ncbi:MAG: thioredoxin domain-containing protein [Bacteroidia bacterium]
MANLLLHETSPYLLQHAHNPVDWHPWNEATLAKARVQNKPLLVSIGYAACHWCHVMEKESFENEEVAAIMNEHFICIKVDREERPDVDQLYMDAITLITGRGGWPLNAFALPGGEPFSGGTYFPKDNWIAVLEQLGGLWKDSRSRILEAAHNLTHHVRESHQLTLNTEDAAFTKAEIDDAFRAWLKQIDFKFGGRKVQANKFPLPANNVMLVRGGHFIGQHQDIDDGLGEQLQAAAELTLEKMALGGIYDQIGGGFARYSVDAYWKVPHFEKMLYDNGQMVSLYSEAWQALPEEHPLRPLYKRIVFDTLEFIARELTSPEGAFYASLDADSEGVEGKFYTWSFDEIKAVLGEKTASFTEYYNVQPHGNWEETNVLFAMEREDQFAKQKGLDLAEFTAEMENSRRALLKARASKVRPALDDKQLTSWNALMLRGYVDAYRVFGEGSFLEAALNNAKFIVEKLSDGGKLWRNYKNGTRSINAFLDDYAYLIDAYLALYDVTFDEVWLGRAEAHMSYVWGHFGDPDSCMFFYTAIEDPIIVGRRHELTDDVTPSSNAMIANSLFVMGTLLNRTSYREHAQKMLKGMKSNIQNQPAWHAVWGRLAMRFTYPNFEIAITGPDYKKVRTAFNQHYLPHCSFAGAKSEGLLPLLKDRFTDKTTIYVCQDNACRLPVATVEAALEQIG